MTVLDFQQEKIRRLLTEFAGSGKLPDFFLRDEFKREYSNVRMLCSYWEHIVDDVSLVPIIWDLESAYQKFDRRRSQAIQADDGKQFEYELDDIKNQFQTVDVRFLSPAVHSGYPSDENPVNILAYEVRRAFLESMGDSKSSKPHQVNIFVLAFFKRHALAIFKALNHDMNLLSKLIEKLPNVYPYDDDSIKARVKAEALHRRDEFLASLSSLQTIYQQLGNSTESA